MNAEMIHSLTLEEVAKYQETARPRFTPSTAREKSPPTSGDGSGNLIRSGWISESEGRHDPSPSRKLEHIKTVKGTNHGN